MTDPSHPAFASLSNADLDAWHPGNPWDPRTPGLARHVFTKPSRGDARVLLECGEGDFGWGGLLWSPMVELAVGRGRVLLCQVEVTANAARVPAACVLLRNLLAYAAAPRAVMDRPVSILAAGRAGLARLLDDAGLRAEDGPPGPGLVLGDPDALDASAAARLHSAMAEDGTEVLVVAAEPRHTPVLEALSGARFGIVEAPTCQVAAVSDPATRGVSASDLSLIDKVTYAPPTASNTVIARHAVETRAGTPLLTGVTAPWEDFFIQGLDAEYLKTAVATMAMEAPRPVRCYGVRVPLGKGALLVSQVLPLGGNERVRRFYARLLWNLGAGFASSFLEQLPGEAQYGLNAVMALAREDRHDAVAMETYFTDPKYTLNNLGEGVFGWMKRIDAHGGIMTIPGSAMKTWYLTVFIASDINRDPERRPSHELPDPGIVPDLLVRSSCPVRVHLNGRLVKDLKTPTEDAVTIEDAALCQGVNRLLFVCTAGAEDVALSAWFRTKHGEPVPGLRSLLTLD